MTHKSENFVPNPNQPLMNETFSLLDVVIYDQILKIIVGMNTGIVYYYRNMGFEVV